MKDEEEISKIELKKVLLRQRQSLPMESKVRLTQIRIERFYSECGGDVFVAFSGGKDSTVLLDIVRKMYGNSVPAVFCDTGVVYPEVREFVKEYENVITVKPERNYREIVSVYGFPVITKEQAGYIREVQNGTTEYTEDMRRGRICGKNGKPKGNVSKKFMHLLDQDFLKISDECCYWLKKRPMNRYIDESGNYPIVGITAIESRLRRWSYLQHGCNILGKNPKSRPIMFWLEEDIWEYVEKNEIKLCPVYDMGYKGTGCMYCLFGVHMEDEPNKIQMMSRTHPDVYRYCIKELGYKAIMNYLKIPWLHPEDRGNPEILKEFL